MEEILRYFPNLSVTQRAQFDRLKPLYEEWNSKINVISRKDIDFFYSRHVLHSLAIAKVIDFKKGTKVLDVGTGGGFPGIPLAILFPDVKFIAVDSIGKKIKVVQAIAESLQLENIKGLNSRAEEVNASFDFIISRAVTRTAKFIPWVKKKFLKDSFNDKKNGYLFLKGGDLREEFSEINKSWEEYAIKDFYEDDFFETKKVVYTPH